MTSKIYKILNIGNLNKILTTGNLVDNQKIYREIFY